MSTASLNLNKTTNQNIKLTDTKATNSTVTKTSSITSTNIPSVKTQEMLLQVATLKGRISFLDTDEGLTGDFGRMLLISAIVFGVLALALATPHIFIACGAFGALGVFFIAIEELCKYSIKLLKENLIQEAMDNPEAARMVKAQLYEEIRNEKEKIDGMKSHQFYFYCNATDRYMHTSDLLPRQEKHLTRLQEISDLLSPKI